MRFCDDYNLIPLPCTIIQATIYVAHLSLYMKFSSVVNYLSAISYFHQLLGIPPLQLSDAVLKLTLKGVKNDQEYFPLRKNPITL